MIKVNIKDVAIKRGITTAYQLQKLMQLQPSIAYKWYKNDLKMIGIESLNSLCEALDCEPSELLVYTPSEINEKKSITEPRKVKELVNNSSLPITNQVVEHLTTNQVAERLNLSRKRINDFIISGELKSVKGKQNHNFISESDLQEFIDNRSGQAD